MKSAETAATSRSTATSRTRRGAIATTTSTATGIANSQPRLCPIRLAPVSTTADATSRLRSATGTSRAAARIAHGQKAIMRRATFAFG